MNISCLDSFHQNLIINFHLSLNKKFGISLKNILLTYRITDDSRSELSFSRFSDSTMTLLTCYLTLFQTGQENISLLKKLKNIDYILQVSRS